MAGRGSCYNCGECEYPTGQTRLCPYESWNHPSRSPGSQLPSTGNTAMVRLSVHINSRTTTQDRTNSYNCAFRPPFSRIAPRSLTLCEQASRRAIFALTAPRSRSPRAASSAALKAIWCAHSLRRSSCKSSAHLRFHPPEPRLPPAVHPGLVRR